jgi:uncharacterized membrane protein
LGIVALAALAHWYDSDPLRGACALAVLAALGWRVPRILRAPFAVLAGAGLLVFAAAGSTGLLDALPALIAAFVGWLFARTLRRGRTPLIGRAIAAIDGPAPLADPAVVRYARRLSACWAGYQCALALIGAALALHAHGWLVWLPPGAPSARAFGALWLPLAVGVLFLGEFALRPRLLPQAPRHGLLAFVRALVRAWPQLLDEG